MSTPVFTTQKTPEEYEKEKLEATRLELKTLHNVLKERANCFENNNRWDENFLEDSNAFAVGDDKNIHNDDLIIFF